jgi:hypothetical protein
MNEPLPELLSKEEVDYVLQGVDDLLVVLRIGRAAHVDTERMDGTVRAPCLSLRNGA